MERRRDTFSLIIAGDIHFNDYTLLKSKVDELLTEKTKSYEIVIVSNPVDGAGILGERYAAEAGFEVAEFPKGDDNHKVSVFTTNKQMVAFANACICFWDGSSSSIRHMIAIAKAAGLPLTVVPF